VLQQQVWLEEEHLVLWAPLALAHQLLAQLAAASAPGSWSAWVLQGPLACCPVPAALHM
jgi:hypothetical protein